MLIAIEKKDFDQLLEQIFTSLDHVIVGFGLPFAAHLRVKSFPFLMVTLPTLGMAWTAGGTKISIWN